jgi:hypothetical protein
VLLIEPARKGAWSRQGSAPFASTNSSGDCTSTALPNEWGHARLPDERGMEMFRLRFVEGLLLTETGRWFGVTRSRVYQVLHVYFGVSTIAVTETAARPRRDAGDWK